MDQVTEPIQMINNAEAQLPDDNIQNATDTIVPLDAKSNQIEVPLTTYISYIVEQQLAQRKL